jgi:threonine/homoserine/homoserine lactone efflux protein
MIELIFIFLIAFCFSFVGSIPPGTLNISILQLGLGGKMNLAWRFAVAAAIVEYPYAWIAIEFEDLITDSPFIADNLQYLTGLTMITLGALNVWSARKPIKIMKSFHESGFRRGLVLSALNPMAMPFWIAVTAYLRSLNWIQLQNNFQIQAYLLGVCLGAFSLLIVVAFLAKAMLTHLHGHAIFERVPGLVLIALGVYALIDAYI